MQDQSRQLDSKEALRYECDAVENLTYTRPLTEEERAEAVQRLIELNADLIAARNEKQATMKEFSDRIKDLTAEIKMLIKRLQVHRLEVTEDCYKFVEDGEAVYYNADGVEVYRRPATTDEKQKTIQAALREQNRETAE